MNTFQPAKRIGLFPEYFFSLLAKKAARVERESGRRVLNFSMGSPDIRPSSIYMDKAAGFFAQDNSHLYPGYGAAPYFSDALTYWYQKRFGVSLEKDEILPLLGAKDGIAHLPQAALNANDEVLVPDPGYPAFSGPAILVGAKPVYYPVTEKTNFTIDLNQLEKKVSAKTKFIWVNFPSNPTGQVMTLADLEKLVAFARAHNIFICYDNAYSEITFDGFIAPSILQVRGARDICVEIGSFSKTFSFAGFRMGWIVGNSAIVAALAVVKSHMDSGLSLPLQKLGAYALTNTDEAWHTALIDSYAKRRNIIAKHAAILGLTFTLPKGGLYLWAKIPKKDKNAMEYCDRLLQEKQILFTPGTAFGKNGDRFVRISICVPIDEINDYF